MRVDVFSASHVHIYTHIYTLSEPINAHTCTHTYILRVFEHWRGLVCTHIHTYMHAYTYKTYVGVCTYINTYIHTCMHTYNLLNRRTWRLLDHWGGLICTHVHINIHTYIHKYITNTEPMCAEAF